MTIYSGSQELEGATFLRTSFRGAALRSCDVTYVATWSGFAYTAFVTDVYSRHIAGWRTASTMTADLVTDALNMAIFSRRHQLLRGVIAHPDAGSQYVSVSYTERLAEIHESLHPPGPGAKTGRFRESPRARSPPCRAFFRHHPEHRRAGHQPTQPCDSFGATGPDTLARQAPPISSTESVRKMNPGDDQLNEPETQVFHVTAGIPPEATLCDRPTSKGGRSHQYKVFLRARDGIRTRTSFRTRRFKTSRSGPSGLAESVRPAHVHRPRPSSPSRPSRPATYSRIPCRNRAGCTGSPSPGGAALRPTAVRLR